MTMQKSFLMGLILMSAVVVVLAAGDCGRNNPCSGGKCCSQFGFCGCSDEYCGKGCISNCNGCRRGASAEDQRECSRNNPCRGGECCSKNGRCGCSDEHCGKGCVGNCNGCRGDRATAESGEATYYTKYVPNSCYGDDTSHFPHGNLIAAASNDVFGNRAACGACYEVTCKGAVSGGHNPCSRNPTVRVKVVDLCPGCNKNSFDLSKEAFSRIAHLDAGRIKISAQKVSSDRCDRPHEEFIAEVV